jgi:hypothetical protein
MTGESLTFLPLPHPVLFQRTATLQSRIYILACRPQVGHHSFPFNGLPAEINRLERIPWSPLFLLNTVSSNTPTVIRTGKCGEMKSRGGFPLGLGMWGSSRSSGELPIRPSCE